MPPERRDVSPYIHAAIVLTVVICVTVLLAMGKIGENSATPLFGAAIGVGGLAAASRRPNGNP